MYISDHGHAKMKKAVNEILMGIPATAKGKAWQKGRRRRELEGKGVPAGSSRSGRKDFGTSSVMGSGSGQPSFEAQEKEAIERDSRKHACNMHATCSRMHVTLLLHACSCMKFTCKFHQIPRRDWKHPDILVVLNAHAQIY